MIKPFYKRSSFYILIALISLPFVHRGYHAHYRVPTQPKGELVTEISDYKLPLVFFAFGDQGTGEADQKQVAKAIEARCLQHEKATGRPADGFLLLGDNFYNDGVQSPSDEQWDKKLLSIYNGPCSSKVPFYPVLGNHDYRGNPQAQIDFSSQNSRWKMPFRFYQLKFGNLLSIIAFDSVFKDLCLNKETCSLDFLFAALDNSFKHQLILAHHPLISTSELGFHYSGQNLTAHFLKAVICKNSTLWLSGHAHHLEHIKTPHCQSEFIISGGGGGNLNPVSGGENSLFSKQSHGFLELVIDEKSLQGSFIDKQGNELYSFSR